MAEQSKAEQFNWRALEAEWMAMEYSKLLDEYADLIMASEQAGSSYEDQQAARCRRALLERYHNHIRKVV